MKLKIFQFKTAKEKEKTARALNRCKNLYILSFSFLKAIRKPIAKIHKIKATTNLKGMTLLINAPITKRAIKKSIKFATDEKKSRINRYIFILTPFLNYTIRN